MPVASKHKVVRHSPTKTTGIYFSQNSRGKKTFECRYVNSEGKRVYEAVGTFEAAKARLADLTNKVNRGDVVANTTMTLNEVLPSWREWRSLKPRSEAAYDSHVRQHIAPKFGRMNLRDINRAELRAWLNSMKRLDGKDGTLGEGSKAVILSTLSSILDYCVEADLLSVNPVRTLGRAKPKQCKIDARILGDGELDALLAACANFPWLRDIVRVTLYGALRIGEPCGLEWQDIDFDTGQITVRQQLYPNGMFGTPKGGKPASIPMSPQARVLLAELKLKAQNKAPDAPVFVNGIGGYRCPRDVSRAFRKARRYAALSVEPRAFRFHDLRHTSISMLANQPGADMVQVQAFARHATLVTTLDYVHKVEKPEWTDTIGAAFAVFGA
jgi:integrase